MKLRARRVHVTWEYDLDELRKEVEAVLDAAEQAVDAALGPRLGMQRQTRGQLLTHYKLRNAAKRLRRRMKPKRVQVSPPPRQLLVATDRGLVAVGKGPLPRGKVVRGVVFGEWPR